MTCKFSISEAGAVVEDFCLVNREDRNSALHELLSALKVTVTITRASKLVDDDLSLP